jgi:CxxC-x17-CxxC domain-containing protein
MFSAECASCHKDTQVPFRPNGKKPVYCSDCFRRDGGQQLPYREERSYAPSRSSFATPAPSSDSGEIKRQLAAINATLEKLLGAVEAMNCGAAPAAEAQGHIPTETAVPKKSAKAKSAPKKAK